MLQRAGKREHQSPEGDEPPRKCARLSSSNKIDEAMCFFCSEGVHDVTTLQVDKDVRECAKLVGHNILLAKLSLGNMIALEAKYY